MTGRECEKWRLRYADVKGAIAATFMLFAGSRNSAMKSEVVEIASK